VKSQAKVLIDWVTLHPLFTAAAIVAVVIILRFILRRRSRAG
jgi:hypothetical protein